MPTVYGNSPGRAMGKSKSAEKGGGQPKKRKYKGGVVSSKDLVEFTNPDKVLPKGYVRKYTGRKTAAGQKIYKPVLKQDA